MNESLHELAEAYINGELTPERLADLENRLRDDEQARLDFLARIEVHAGLAWEHRGIDVPSPLSIKNSPNIITFPRLVRTAAAAAAIALLGTIAWFTIRPAKTDDSIVVIKASLHGLWADGSEAAPQVSLGTGIWELQSGLVELETGTGTTLLLEGPASLELTDKLHARLISGNLVVRMPKGKSGFVVDMPRMKVTDLGTEFGVSVSANGESRVQVYDGKVRAESGDSTLKELAAGETISCAVTGEMTPAVFREDRYIRKFPMPKPGYQTGGPLYSKSTLTSIDVMPAPASLAIDGDLSDWDQTTEFHTTCEPPYDRTYFVDGRMMYDSENLYIGAKVGDPVPMRNAARTGAEFAGGSIIVRISADRKLGWPLKGSTSNARSSSPLPDSVNEKISSIVMWYDAKTHQPQIQLLHAFDSRGAKINPSGWSGAFRQNADGHGYTLEYRIPWHLLHCSDDPPRSGDELAGLWMAHWSDEDGRACRGQLVDVTNADPAAIHGIAPFVFFQNGPSWGKVNYR